MKIVAGKILGLVYINVLVGGFKYERERGEYAAISSRLIAADKNGSVNKFFIEVRVPTYQQFAFEILDDVMLIDVVE